MDKMVYTTSQLAEMAKVSSRTLRYYDKVGLLSPSDYSESGYRLYTDEDFPRLQHILVLKFLGFSLAEIKAFLHNGPGGAKAGNIFNGAERAAFTGRPGNFGRNEKVLGGLQPPARRAKTGDL
ncbi:UNVERIFIED_CONTAM: DNA-binding transcriptional MerR regulator [Brevibacillus sp. OAP136]